MSDEEELNEKWKIHDIVDEAVRGALHYDESSKQSAKDIAVLQTNHKNIMEKMESLEKKVDDGFKEIKDLLKEAMAQKANKWVEKVFIWFLITIATGLLAYLGTLLLKLIAIHL